MEPIRYPVSRDETSSFLSNGARLLVGRVGRSVPVAWPGAGGSLAGNVISTASSILFSRTLTEPEPAGDSRCVPPGRRLGEAWPETCGP
jgi:hypothetical protein